MKTWYKWRNNYNKEVQKVHPKKLTDIFCVFPHQTKICKNNPSDIRLRQQYWIVYAFMSCLITDTGIFLVNFEDSHSEPGVSNSDPHEQEKMFRGLLIK